MRLGHRDEEARRRSRQAACLQDKPLLRSHSRPGLRARSVIAALRDARAAFADLAIRCPYGQFMSMSRDLPGKVARASSRHGIWPADCSAPACVREQRAPSRPPRHEAPAHVRVDDCGSTREAPGAPPLAWASHVQNGHPPSIGGLRGCRVRAPGRAEPIWPARCSSCLAPRQASASPTCC